jgi:hypothetical protein
MIKKRKKKISDVLFLTVFGHQNPGSVSGSGFTGNAESVSGSGFNESGFTTLQETVKTNLAGS